MPAPEETKISGGAPRGNDHPNLQYLERVMACPNCDARMEERSCKRRCPRCHYLDDCGNLH
jgi:Zn finger protein HypA/HybF involved in hydrogenase expression